ncbi:MAG TPA: FCD domain-containing protein [Candidatus Lachnoclostridium pullistercoris]|uniref:FCD domain-containing protein n=1 Tax=Candidatus Lachnoclostridium pullistercoris TaxID=2838632 RepID=A0A9D2PH85_9FIRM|nr:FCD domain-containing protein [Candidatus Lachnoclostridium pullistercoris]
MEKIYHKSLPEKTADGISDFIYRENYGAGAKLPGEKELAAMLEVSRNTVREAIRILAEKKVVEVRRGAGTFVSSRRGLSDDLLGLSLVSDKKKLVRDLLELRLLIEPRMAAMAAERASAAQIARLKELFLKMEKEWLAGHIYFEQDMEFHTFIAGCSGNLVVHSLLPPIQQAILLQENVTGKRLGKKTVEAHRRILAAIEGRRSCEAQDAMTVHLIQNQERILELMREK